MRVYIENPKDTTRKLLELINEFNNVAGYKINVQKPVAFLYTNSQMPERESKETIPYVIISKRKISRKKHTQEDKRAVLRKL